MDGHPFSRPLNERQSALLDRIYTKKISDKAKKRFRLFWAQEGLCFWCGEAMALTFQKPGHCPPESVTLEHLDSRLSPIRGTMGRGTIRVVAAHAKCNIAFNKDDERAIGISELRTRAKRHPQPAPGGTGQPKGD